jgi:hypothetical protein
MEWESVRSNQSHILLVVSSGADGQIRSVLFERLVAATIKSASAPLGIHIAASGRVSGITDLSPLSEGRHSSLLQTNSYYQGLHRLIETMRAHLEANSWSRASVLQVSKSISDIEAAMRAGVLDGELIPFVDREL